MKYIAISLLFICNVGCINASNNSSEQQHADKQVLVQDASQEKDRDKRKNLFIESFQNVVSAVLKTKEQKTDIDNAVLHQQTSKLVKKDKARNPSIFGELYDLEGNKIFSDPDEDDQRGLVVAEQREQAEISRNNQELKKNETDSTAKKS